MTDDQSIGDDYTLDANSHSPDVSAGDATTLGGHEGGNLGDVDRYILLGKIGEGGFGSVWKAKDKETGLNVALKALPPVVSGNPDELARVRNNFALVSKLTHPNICTLRHLHKIQEIDAQAQSNISVGADGYLVVMDCIDGVTLTQYRLLRGGVLNFEDSINICAQIAKALDYAHSQKIIHRDIKPSNIMMSNSGEVKILDFGLAAEVRSSMARVSQEITDTSGTRPYMSPEQWLGERQDARSDQYALAVVIYELLSGEVPFVSAFETNDPVAMLNAMKTGKPESLSELTDDQNKILLKALAKSKQDRWPDCGAVVKQLSGDEKVKSKMEQPEAVPVSDKRKRHPVMKFLVWSIILVILFFVRRTMITEKENIEIIRKRVAKAEAYVDAPRISSHSTRTITIDEKGKAHLDDLPVTYNELREAMVEQGKSNSEVSIIVRADKGVRHGELLQVLSIVEEAGLRNINFNTQSRSDEQPPKVLVKPKPVKLVNSRSADTPLVSSIPPVDLPKYPIQRVVEMTDAEGDPVFRVVVIMKKENGQIPGKGQIVSYSRDALVSFINKNGYTVSSNLGSKVFSVIRARDWDSFSSDSDSVTITYMMKKEDILP